ncbi:Imm10 family immunity protein [Actinoalloteichus caeruleus]|uniref:Immunity protein 10 n=1 Tax=Actinoalloteichus caeruleus DSM 43889 TaxID=1120930 RepID=A0ABT1JGH0_ACTCY|nr:Imm10 family immunity protein [Actinoalloteichus caeruleus]MCP2331289.1 Immunity protein 10 [Actinoalloteichus caeruleus DSM 43889]
MRLTATEVGFFEDYKDEEALEVGVSGMDDAGVQRSFSIQRSTYEPDEQDVQSGMDSYNVSNEQGFTVYGCLRRVRLNGAMLDLEFTTEDANILETSTVVEVDLRDSGVDVTNLSMKLREILDWGAPEKRPELIGLNVSE